jgi:hypothetical protein
VSLITVAAGQPIRATHCNQFTRWITGVIKDTPAQITTTSASVYTTTFTNEDTSAGLISDFIYGATHVMTVNKTGVTVNVPLVASNPLAGLFSSAGQLLYGAGGTGVSTLNIGSSNQGLLTNAAGTAPTWGSSLQSLMASAGSLVVASGANTPAHLPRGTTAFQEFVMNGAATGQTWATGVLASAVTAGDTFYATGLNAIAKLAGGTKFQQLGMNAGATAPAWQNCALALSTANGQLFYANGTGSLVALTIGTSGQFLTTDGTSPSWGAGPAAGITLLATRSGGGGTSTSFAFTSISASYREIWVVGNMRANTGVSFLQNLNVQLNGDTGASYGWSNQYSMNTTTTLAGSAASSTTMSVGFVPDATAAANEFGTFVIKIAGYAQTTWNKGVRCDWGMAYGFANVLTGSGNGRWASTAAVTSVAVSIGAGVVIHSSSTLSLYGVTAT